VALVVVLFVVLGRCGAAMSAVVGPGAPASDNDGKPD